MSQAGKVLSVDEAVERLNRLSQGLGTVSDAAGSAYSPSNQPDGSYYKLFPGGDDQSGGAASAGSVGFNATANPAVGGILATDPATIATPIANLAPSDEAWYQPLPSDGRYAVGRSPDLTQGEGIQPLVTGLNGRGYIPADGDQDWLARIMFAESGSAPQDFAKVGWAVVNRVGDRQFRPTLAGVVTQTYGSNGGHQLAYGTPQWDLTADPNSLKGLDAVRYNQALQTAGDILNGNIADPTNGANYFYTGPTPNTFFKPRIASGRLVPSGGPEDNDQVTHFLRDTRH